MSEIVSASVPAGKYDIQLVNINGQKVYEQHISHQNATEQIDFSLEQYPVGIYMVRVTGNDINWTGKLIIQR